MRENFHATRGYVARTPPEISAVLARDLSFIAARISRLSEIKDNREKHVNSRHALT